MRRCERMKCEGVGEGGCEYWSEEVLYLIFVM